MGGLATRTWEGFKVDIPISSIISVAEPILKLVVAPVLGAWLLKKIRDRDTREALAVAADAALVLAIKKSHDKGLKNLGELIREVVSGILANPAVTNNPGIAENAAAAAVARAGLASIQRIYINPDGTMVPENLTIGQPR